MPRPSRTTSKSPARVHFGSKQSDRRQRSHHESLAIDNPAAVAGLVAWYDFSDASTLFLDATRLLPVAADAGPILGVVDKSPIANHLTGLVTAGPLYKVNIQNSKSVARFDGTDDTLEAADHASIELDTDSTVFIVTSLSASGGTATIISKSQTGNTAGAYNYFLSSSDKPQLDRPFIEGGVAATNALTVPTWYIIAVKASGTAISHYRNGVANGTDTLAVGTATNTTLRIGTFRASTLNPYTGDMGEIIIYNTVLTDDQINAVGKYLNAKWNITWTGI